MTQNLEDAEGTAERVADTMDDNLNGAILGARSALEGFILATGDAGATDGLVLLANSLATAFRFGADNIDLLSIGLGVYVAANLATSASQSTLLATTVANTRAFFAKTAQLRVTTIAMIAANAAARGLGVGLLALAANPIVLGITAITAAFFLLRKETEETVDTLGEADTALSSYNTALSRIERDQDVLISRTQDLSLIHI